ncbi:unnamed protein product [Cuscuta campestris]|uniref:Uncharacterized protein n=1 Tax=Cuscuta campestris TaxID=132261 RepID=A0A484KRG4_9ASTE|nr:unnamed protein product [Cuscuta campestris]
MFGTYPSLIGPSGSEGRGTGRGTNWSGVVPVSGHLPEGAVLNDPSLRYLRIRAGDGDVGGDDEVHDEEGVWQAPLGGDGGAIRHVNHDVFFPVDRGAMDDSMNRLEILVGERGVATVSGAKNPDDHRLVVENPIIATICRDVVTAGGQPCNPSKSSQVKLYVIEIDATANGIPVPVEIGVEGLDIGGIEGGAALGDEGPQTRLLELIVEVVVPFLLGKQLGQHPWRRDTAFGEVGDEASEFFLQAKLEKGSVQVRKGLRRRGCGLGSDLLLGNFALGLSSGHD